MNYVRKTHFYIYFRLILTHSCCSFCSFLLTLHDACAERFIIILDFPPRTLNLLNFRCKTAHILHVSMMAGHFHKLFIISTKIVES